MKTPAGLQKTPSGLTSIQSRGCIPPFPFISYRLPRPYGASRTLFLVVRPSGLDRPAAPAGNGHPLPGGPIDPADCADRDGQNPGWVSGFPDRHYRHQTHGLAHPLHLAAESVKLRYRTQCHGHGRGAGPAGAHRKPDRRHLAISPPTPTAKAAAYPADHAGKPVPAAVLPRGAADVRRAQGRDHRRDPSGGGPRSAAT